VVSSAMQHVSSHGVLGRECLHTLRTEQQIKRCFTTHRFVPGYLQLR
jgi:hypothetical protein